MYVQKFLPMLIVLYGGLSSLRILNILCLLNIRVGVYTGNLYLAEGEGAGRTEKNSSEQVNGG